MKYSLLLWIALAITPAYAVIETYQFNDAVTEQRYHQFIEELRCPKCQNQNLAGSNAPIAEDLRNQLHRLLQEGRSDREIVDFMVARYGDFVLYRPRFNAETAALWFAPVGFLMFGAIVILVVYRRQQNTAVEAVDDAPLDAQEQQRLQQLLDKSGSENHGV